MVDEQRQPQSGDVVGGKYRVEAPIASGGMGVVFHATHDVTGKAVALKWLHPELASRPGAAQRFVREARAAARIRHPNVVDIYDIVEGDGATFLVMELLKGETLRALLRRQRPSIEDALELLIPAIRGVAAAHREGVVHRDIKPDNLFVTRHPDHPEQKIPKVLDFGISKVTTDHPQREGTLTATGATMGTPHYMSLEQLQGEGDVDARSDIYAFGVVLYECLTGRRPFESENFSAIVVKVATEDPVDPTKIRKDLPPALGAVLLKAMARHREDRFQTLEELIGALTPFLGQTVRVQNMAPATPAEPDLGDAAPPTKSADRTRTSGHDDAPPSPSDRPPRSQSRTVPRVAAVALAAAALVLLFTRPWAPSADGPSDAITHDATATAVATFPPKPPGSGEGPANADQARGTSESARPRTAAAGGAREGWVYLGEYDDQRWIKRYFTGWEGGLPKGGTTIRSSGRSYLRDAKPNALGDMAQIERTLGPNKAVQVLDASSWQDSAWMWARVRMVK